MFIDKDWIFLYCILFFYLFRGEENLRVDIDDIMNIFFRDIFEVYVKQVFYRWCCMYMRVSVDDLKKVLIVIKWKDIVDKVDEELFKKRVVKFKIFFVVKFFKVFV